MTTAVTDQPSASPASSAFLIRLCLFAALFSVSLSAWLVSQDLFLNDDGMLYLETAELLSQGQWQQAFLTYNWPFLPALIAATDRLLPVGMQASAYLVMGLLNALVVVGFILLTARFSLERIVLAAAALTILVYPPLNGYRTYVMRDPGMWAAMLLALYSLAGYLRYHRSASALAWGASIVAAVLFRAEAVVLAAALPLLAWTQPDRGWRDRLRDFVKLNGPLLSCAAALLLLALFKPEIIGLARDKAEEYQRWFGQNWLVLGEQFATRAAALSRAVFTELAYRYSDEYRYIVLGGGLVAMLLTKLASAVGVVFLVAGAYGLGDFARAVRQTPYRQVLPFAMLLLVLAPTLHLLSYYFLSGRYLVPLALLLTLPAAFGFARLVRRWRSAARPGGAGRNRRLLYALVPLVLLVLLLNKLVVSRDASLYVKQAVDWVNSELGPRATLYTDNRVIQFYTRRPRENLLQFHDYEGRFLRPALPAGAETYVATTISHRHPEREQVFRTWLGGPPVQVFSNARGDRALIWRVAPRSD